MKIILTQREALKIFHGALVDGLQFLSCYGLRLEYANAQYAVSRRKLRKCCFEDVLIQMLKDGFPLRVIDGEGYGEYSRAIYLKGVLNGIPKVKLSVLGEAIEETGDSGTADTILQTVFFGKVVFS